MKACFSIFIRFSVILILCFSTSRQVVASDFGGRSAEEIQTEFDKKAPEIDRMYQKTLRKNPELPSIKIVFILSLDKEGNLTKCDWIKEEVTFADFNKNVCEKIKEMNFGIGEQTVFDYQFRFFPS